jgi:hypothetical protein
MDVTWQLHAFPCFPAPCLTGAGLAAVAERYVSPLLGIYNTIVHRSARHYIDSAIPPNMNRAQKTESVYINV